VFLAALVGLLLAGCDTDTPQNTFAPEGDVAEKQRTIFLMAMWPAIVIMIGVFLAVIVMVLRFRRTDDNEIPVQTHGNTPLEIAWTILPAVLLAILGIPMLIVLFDIGREPEDDAFQVNVTGVRFLWQFEYPDIEDANGEPLQGENNEIHLPVGREIAINLRSRDVIHSFAIPRIAGTRDAIPSLDGPDGDTLPDESETFWIQVDEPGTFAGQCRELCGADHANMLITAFAHSDEDFEAWAEEELASQNARINDDAVAER
jgi:cytochrome c oxidase subunit 2